MTIYSYILCTLQHYRAVGCGGEGDLRQDDPGPVRRVRSRLGAAPRPEVLDRSMEVRPREVRPREQVTVS